MMWHEKKTQKKNVDMDLLNSGHGKQYLTKTHGKHEGLNTQTNDKTRDTCEQ